VSTSRESASENITPDDNSITDLLAMTDATFVLIAHECKSSLPPNIHVSREKWLTRVFHDIKSLISKHGYATSISHAFILTNTHLQRNQHVTIVEADASFSQSASDRRCAGSVTRPERLGFHTARL
jgi:hypothetical protein